MPEGAKGFLDCLENETSGDQHYYAEGWWAGLCHLRKGAAVVQNNRF